ncbi:hypothetical protein CFBP2044_11790 [Xanthomonas hortorum pv. cynarae]|nr:hypothetical protein CFBP2044_11790 [Xanthomonas hortorum pv. cynarae]CAD0313545.1 hypothetical protein CFBP2044_11790 [Xanthomonas hortorum pv. cynarae]
MSRSIVLSMLALLLATLTATATAAPIVYGVNAHDNRPGYPPRPRHASSCWPRATCAATGSMWTRAITQRWIP